MSVLPPHEALHKELLAEPGQRGRLEDAVRANEWAPNYFHAHEVVHNSDAGTVLPVALYIDGVPFTKRDGMIGFHIVNMVSGAGHIVAVLRKSASCQCGYKVWCIFYAELSGCRGHFDHRLHRRGPPSVTTARRGKWVTKSGHNALEHPWLRRQLCVICAVTGLSLLTPATSQPGRAKPIRASCVARRN